MAATKVDLFTRYGSFVDGHEEKFVNIGQYWWEIFTPYSLVTITDKRYNLIIETNELQLGVNDLEFTQNNTQEIEQLYPGGNVFLNWAIENGIEGYKIYIKETKKHRYIDSILMSEEVSLESFIEFARYRDAVLFKMRWTG